MDGRHPNVLKRTTSLTFFSFFFSLKSVLPAIEEPHLTQVHNVLHLGCPILTDSKVQSKTIAFSENVNRFIVKCFIRAVFLFFLRYF